MKIKIFNSEICVYALPAANSFIPSSAEKRKNMRKVYNFNDGWWFKKGVQESVSQDSMAEWESVALPHTWNAADGQDGGNDYYRGTCTYAKYFDVPDFPKGSHLVLDFAGAAMTAEVSVNGTRLAKHEGGYSTFRVDITDALLCRHGAENLCVVTVDNSVNDRVYPQKADFTFYGGIYREVRLLVISEYHFALLENGTPGVKVTPFVDIDSNRTEVTVESWQNTAGKVRYRIYAPDGCGSEYWKQHRGKAGDSCLEEYIAENASVMAAEQTVSCGNITEELSLSHAEANFSIESAVLWDGTNNPYLYVLCAELLDEDGAVADAVWLRFGCRTFSFDRERGFFLNGHAYPLRGVSRHQDRAEVGNVLTTKMHEEDLDIIREIGANTVRLAHYQHAQYFYDLCDEAGIVVWAEIPYITQHMPNGRENTLSQMRELITQCHHHASIVCWGLSNEITASGQVDEDLLDNHRELQKLCHSLDKTRPTTMAHAFMLETDSPLIEIADIGSYNLYYGWYLGELGENESFFDEYHRRFPDRIIGFSEYGADANPQFQSETPEQGDYSETYQCVYHEHLLHCIEKRPYLWATHVWNLFDFAADGRDEGGAHGVNQKGLVTMDRRLKKDAFYLYKAHWSSEPFVHICGRRYEKRAVEQTTVKIYSNQKKMELYVDGALFAEQAGRYIFTFSVPLSGSHAVEARCMTVDGRALSDSIRLQFTEQEEPSYRMRGKETVVNWFDRETFDPTCFSIMDTMGAVMETSEGAALIGKIMEKAQASRGEVAQATRGNAVLEKMLAKMTLQSLLKQAGDALSAEEIKGLNVALQKIRKPVK